MSTFRIQGGKPLKGTITPQGAKNEALQVMCATLLTEEPVTISNIPDITDVQKLILLLEVLGVKVERLAAHTYRFDSSCVDLRAVDLDKLKGSVAKLRGSIMILGPLLARFGYAQIIKPGGDRIGRRRLDTHFLGMTKLGATVAYNIQAGIYTFTVPKQLRGAYILLDEASVTGTANTIMAASLAQGTSTIYHAACEPYIQQLCSMLIAMGARIEGVGSNLLTIHGVDKLHGTTHAVMPDIIEIGSFIGLAAMTQADLVIKNAYVTQLHPVLEPFRRMGIQIDTADGDIVMRPQTSYCIEKDLDSTLVTLADGIWPGCQPDLLSVLLVAAIQAKGTVLIHQKMYESRLFFVDKLIDMGAEIVLCDPHRVVVIGLNRAYALRGIRMASPDIRAGIALLIAALSAEGTSIIENIGQIDRGYEKIDERLGALGADIERIESRSV
ncbi:MAG: UDP-N-acetylglucosamine 1-carboxyvinyltransferase [Bacteroidota bacterium]